MREFDFESIKVKALEQLKAGKSLLGKDEKLYYLSTVIF